MLFRSATSTRRQTVTSTRTLGTAGSKLRSLLLIPSEAVRLLRKDGDRKEKILSRRPSVGVAGSPEQRAPVVRQAAEEEAGVVEAVVGGKDVQLRAAVKGSNERFAGL